MGPLQEHGLERFQDSLRKEDLLAYIRKIGGNVAEYAIPMEMLEPVFRPLSFGLHPALDRLNGEALRSHAEFVADILLWLADSSKADIKTAALTLMGALGWAIFVPRLEQSLSSETPWERAAARNALDLRIRGTDGEL